MTYKITRVFRSPKKKKKKTNQPFTIIPRLTHKWTLRFEPPSFIRVFYDYNDPEGGLLNRESEEQSPYQAKWLCDVMHRGSNKKNPHHTKPSI